jgi:type VI secretion system protein VasD
VIIPNQEQIYKVLFDPKARFLGIIANFRNLDGNTTWRYVVDLKKDSHNVVDLKIDGNKIEEDE